MEDYREEEFVTELREQVRIMNGLLDQIESDHIPEQSIAASIDQIRSNLKKLKGHCDRAPHFGLFNLGMMHL